MQHLHANSWYKLTLLRFSFFWGQFLAMWSFDLQRKQPSPGFIPAARSGCLLTGTFLFFLPLEFTSEASSFPCHRRFFTPIFSAVATSFPASVSAPESRPEFKGIWEQEGRDSLNPKNYAVLHQLKHFTTSWQPYESFT